MTVKLRTEHHFEFLRLKGGCTGSSESTLVKIPHCWKSHVAAHIMVGVPSRTVSKELHVIEGWKKRDITGADPVFWKGGSYV